MSPAGEVVEQTETVRWSLFPVGNRNRYDWSIHATALPDGTWSLRCPGYGWLDVDHVWQYGTRVDARLARLTLDDARRLAVEQLPDIIVNGCTAREAYDGWARRHRDA